MNKVEKPIKKLTSLRNIPNKFKSLPNKNKVGLLSIPIIVICSLFVGAHYLNPNNNTEDQTKRNAVGSTIGVDLPDEVFEGLEARDEGVCEGMFETVIPDSEEEELCTVGPESLQNFQEEFNAPTADTHAAPTNLKVPCYGDGQSGPRVQAMYVTSTDRTDRFDTIQPYIVGWAGHVDSQINQSANKNGGEAHVKWVTNADCELDVQKVLIPPDTELNFSTTIRAVKDAGYSLSNRKYLLWVDVGVMCGIGNMYLDDRADPNLNNNSVLGPMYARTDNLCWGLKNSAELHELMHMLGAVQKNTPNSTGHGHCTDEHDRMCYNDGGGEMRRVCRDTSNESLLDCKGDDYFNSKPESESYLASHWNIFNSNYIYSEIPSDTEPPSAPTGLRGFWDGEKVALSWTASEDDISETITYNIYRRPSGGSAFWEKIGETTETKWGDTNVELGEGYRYELLALDEAGNPSERTEDILVSVPADGAPRPEPVIIPPPPQIENLFASDITANSFKLTWKLPADSSRISKLKVYINDYKYAELGNGATSYNACCGLASNAQHKVYIRSIGNDGQFTDSQLMYVKTSTNSTPTPDPEPTPDPTLGPPPPVNNLSTYNITDNSFSIKWDSIGSHPDVVDVDVFFDSVPSWQTISKWHTTASSPPGLEGGVYGVVVRTIDGDGNTTDVNINVTTTNYFNPSVIENLKPYNLVVTSVDSNYYYIKATMNSTGGAAYRHEVAINGSNSGTQWYLTNRNYTHDFTFRRPYSDPAGISSFSIIVKDSAGNIITRSEPLPY